LGNNISAKSCAARQDGEIRQYQNSSALRREKFIISDPVKIQLGDCQGFATASGKVELISPATGLKTSIYLETLPLGFTIWNSSGTIPLLLLNEQQGFFYFRNVHERNKSSIENFRGRDPIHRPDNVVGCKLDLLHEKVKLPQRASCPVSRGPRTLSRANDTGDGE
jgi:hypothetical protein